MKATTKKLVALQEQHDRSRELLAAQERLAGELLRIECQRRQPWRPAAYRSTTDAQGSNEAAARLPSTAVSCGHIAPLKLTSASLSQRLRSARTKAAEAQSAVDALHCGSRVLSAGVLPPPSLAAPTHQSSGAVVVPPSHFPLHRQRLQPLSAEAALSRQERMLERASLIHAARSAFIDTFNEHVAALHELVPRFHAALRLVAATNIQRRYRGWIARCDYRVKRECIAAIQRSGRAFIARRLDVGRRLLARNSRLLLQRVGRAMVTRREFNDEVQMRVREYQRKLAAVDIQKSFRRHSTRSTYVQYKRESRGATVLQRVMSRFVKREKERQRVAIVEVVAATFPFIPGIATTVEGSESRLVGLLRVEFARRTLIEDYAVSVLRYLASSARTTLSAVWKYTLACALLHGALVGSGPGVDLEQLAANTASLTGMHALRLRPGRSSVGPVLERTTIMNLATSNDTADAFAKSVGHASETGEGDGALSPGGRAGKSVRFGAMLSNADAGGLQRATRSPSLAFDMSTVQTSRSFGAMENSMMSRSSRVKGSYGAGSPYDAVMRARRKDTVAAELGIALAHGFALGCAGLSRRRRVAIEAVQLSQLEQVARNDVELGEHVQRAGIWGLMLWRWHHNGLSRALEQSSAAECAVLPEAQLTDASQYFGALVERRRAAQRDAEAVQAALIDELNRAQDTRIRSLLQQERDARREQRRRIVARRFYSSIVEHWLKKDSSVSRIQRFVRSSLSRRGTAMEVARRRGAAAVVDWAAGLLQACGRGLAARRAVPRVATM